MDTRIYAVERLIKKGSISIHNQEIRSEKDKDKMKEMFCKY